MWEKLMAQIIMIDCGLYKQFLLLEEMVEVDSVQI